MPGSSNNSQPMGIIIPYRNRKEHLDAFLPHMTQFLKDMPYQIFVIEQSENKPFNRGKLLNIGFEIAKDNCRYVCFHDVDMLPLKADYSYPKLPTHLASNVEQFEFEMPYPSYFGGVTLFNIQNFEKINGFANEYWGWGAEDDDLRTRCQIAGLKIENRSGFFSSLKHARVTEDDPLVLANQEKLEEILYGDGKLPEEGLKTLKYELIKKTSNHLIHHLLVKI